MKTKQVIVVRRDLKNKEGHKVKGGKIAAQVAHAAMGSLKSMMEVKVVQNYRGDKLHTDYVLKVDPNSVLEDWWEGAFTKPVLGCDTEQELYEFQKKAKAAGLPFALIVDSGRTEFNGPTTTCIGIGPGTAEEIDAITGHLKLL